VITLGTPHRGTRMAAFGIGENCRQMTWVPPEVSGHADTWLAHLAASEHREIRARIISIYSHHDNIVWPQTSSHLEGARNIEFHGVGHVALAGDRRIQHCVIEEIRKASDSEQARPRCESVA
jgi:hypothetical protein